LPAVLAVHPEDDAPVLLYVPAAHGSWPAPVPSQ